MRHRTVDRDDGLRRVSRLTRWLTAGAAALVGILSALVAQAIPGTSGSASTPPPTSSGSGGSTQAAPPPSTTTTTQDPSLTDPGLQPAPAPIPTPHHHVATSGGS
jgi:hypothetical protein